MQTSSLKCFHLFYPCHTPKFLPSLLHAHLLFWILLFCSSSKMKVSRTPFFALATSSAWVTSSDPQTLSHPCQRFLNLYPALTSAWHSRLCQLDLSKWMSKRNLKLSRPGRNSPLSHPYFLPIPVNETLSTKMCMTGGKKTSSACMVKLCFIHLYVLFSFLKRPFQLTLYPFYLENFCISFKNQF